MPYVHQRTGWPKLLWEPDSLSTLLTMVRHLQGRHLGRMEALGFDLRTDASLCVLTEEVVRSSAIEGDRLDPGEVRSSIARQLGLDVAGTPRSATRNVEGVVEMMIDATRGFQEPLSADRLFAWHAALFPSERSGLRKIPVGRWRTGESGPMRVVSGPIGRERVHFEAPDAARVPAEMERFLDWFAEPTDLDPVLKAGVAHLWFVTVHPFADGNGRIARAIAELCLCRADGTAHRYYSMSTGIAEERSEYYRQLEIAQHGSTDITSWLEWFLRCLQRTIENVDQILASVLFRARFWQRVLPMNLHERQRRVLERMLGDFRGSLTSTKYAKLAKCSNDTALRDIRGLLEIGVLVRNPAGGRSTSYQLAEPGEER